MSSRGESFFFFISRQCAHPLASVSRLFEVELKSRLEVIRWFGERDTGRGEAAGFGRTAVGAC